MPNAFENWYIYFNDETGKQIASCEYTGIPFYKGMRVTFHELEHAYVVKDWWLHYGHGDENPGLRVKLEKAEKLITPGFEII